jgi:hypothetical protein
MAIITLAPGSGYLDALKEIEELVEDASLVGEHVLQLLADQLQLGALGLHAVESEVVILGPIS